MYFDQQYLICLIKMYYLESRNRKLSYYMLVKLCLQFTILIKIWYLKKFTTNTFLNKKKYWCFWLALFLYISINNCRFFIKSSTQIHFKIIKISSLNFYTYSCTMGETVISATNFISIIETKSWDFLKIFTHCAKVFHLQLMHFGQNYEVFFSISHPLCGTFIEW